MIARGDFNGTKNELDNISVSNNITDVKRPKWLLITKIKSFLFGKREKR